MIIYVAAGVAVVSLWMLLRRRRTSTIPGPGGLPLLGNLNDVKSDKFHQKLDVLAKKYGPILKLNVLGTEVVVLNKPELVRKAFDSKQYGDIFNDRPESFIGKYIATGYSGIWVARYDDTLVKLRDAFHRTLNLAGDGAKSLEDAVHRELEELVTTLTKVTQDNGNEVDPAPVIERSICNLVTVLMLGETMTDDDYATVRDTARALNNCLLPSFELVLYKFPMLRFLPGYFGRVYGQMVAAAGRLHDRFFMQGRATYKAGVERGMLDAFFKLQARETGKDGKTWFTDEQINGLVQTIVGGTVLAGTNGLLAAILVLLHHPESFEKIHKEIMRTAGTKRLPKLTDRNRMPYTQAAILECLRLANIIPFNIPHCCMQDTVFEGHTIWKGTRIMSNIWSINRDPEIWDDPETFRPDRFLNTIGTLVPREHRLREAMLVFGVGRRTCVGEELAMSVLFLYVTALVQAFQITPTTTGELPAADSRGFTTGFVLIPSAYKVHVVSRRNNNFNTK